VKVREEDEEAIKKSKGWQAEFTKQMVAAEHSRLLHAVFAV
jgi:hypothetical protein